MKQIPVIVASFCITACSWLHPKYESGLEGQPLPGFNLILQDSVTKFQTATIPTGKPFILLLYRPNCSFCQGETQDILKNIKAFNDIPIYMITSFPYSSIMQFSAEFGLDKHTNIVLLRDSASLLLDYFKAPGVPYLAFYNNQKKLKRVLVGQSPFTDLSKILTDLSVGHLASIP